MMVQMMRMPRGAVQVFGRRSSEINKSALLASPAAWESEGGRKDILDYIAIYWNILTLKYIGIYWRNVFRSKKLEIKSSPGAASGCTQAPGTQLQLIDWQVLGIRNFWKAKFEKAKFIRKAIWSPRCVSQTSVPPCRPPYYQLPITLNLLNWFS